MLNIDLMSVEEVKFKKAIAKGELVEFLGGFPGYYIQSEAADLPTDFDAAFTPIFTRIKDDPEIQDLVVNAIKSLSTDPEYGWGAIFHIGNLVLLKKYQAVDLIDSDLLNSVADGLRKNKEAFKSLKKWEGKNFDDGVWALVRNKNRNLHNDYNITVLPEEL